MSVRRPIVVFAIAVTTLGVGRPASAQQAPQAQRTSPARTSRPPAGAAPLWEEVERHSLEEAVHAVERKHFLRRGRFEIAPLVGLSVNDPLTLHFAAGGDVRYHITDRWSVGATYRKFFRTALPARSEVIDKFGVFPEEHLRDFLAAVDVAWVPAIGKFVFFGAGLAHFDVALLAGGGVVRTFQPGAEGAWRPMGTLGVATRIALAQWLALEFSLRDFAYIESFRAGRRLVNDVMLGAGLAFFLPPHIHWRTAR